MTAVTGFVLAGGKSMRMGKDKALLDLAGRPLIVHMLDLAQSASDQVRVVGDPSKFAQFAPVVEDIYSERGPLGGIQAALVSSATELNLLLGVDLPFLESHFLKYLVSRARSSGAVVTVPFAGGHLQTLCAVYRKQFAGFAEEALSAGRNKVDAVFAQISVCTVSEREIESGRFNLAMFRNLNTPEDWDRAQPEFESRGVH